MSIFVDRSSIFDLFYQFIHHNNPQWLLLLDGVEGIGKTTLLHKLAKKHAVGSHIIEISLAPTSLRNDPLVMLNKLAAEFPDQTFQEYTKYLVKAYDDLSNAHIKSENSIIVGKDAILNADSITQTVNNAYTPVAGDVAYTLKQLFVECHINMIVEGSVEAGEITQIASVDLGKALQALKNQIRDELTIKFIQMVARYLNANPRRFLVLFIDDCEQLQLSATGKEYVDWLLTNLFGTIYQRFPRRIRVLMAITGTSSWVPVDARQIKKETLLPIPYEDVKLYLNQRGHDNNKVAKTIFKVTQGHPLCMVLATDLYTQNVGAGAKALEKYATNPFNSRLLAYQLFMATVGQMPDEAMKKLLQYAPTFRVLDDQIVDNVLAVELGLTKDKIRELIEQLKAYPFVETSGERIVFRPAIREHVLHEMRRRSQQDPLYRALHRRAFIYFGQQWKQSVGRVKDGLQVQMVHHEMSLAPQTSQRRFEELVEEAITNENAEQVRDILEYARSEDATDITVEDVQELEKNLPQDYRPAWFMIERQPETTLFSTSSDKDKKSPWIVSAITGSGGYIYAVGKKWADAAIKYITSPLRKMERHLRRTKRIHRTQEKIFHELVSKRIPEVTAIYNEAISLKEQIDQGETPRLVAVQQANNALVQRVNNAVANANRNGEISGIEFDIISGQFDVQNKVVGQFNKAAHKFGSRYEQFVNTVSSADKFVNDVNSRAESITQEIAHRQRESRELFQSNAIIIFESKDEEKRAREILKEIDNYHMSAMRSQDEMNHAIEKYSEIRTPSIRASKILHDSILKLQNEIDAANRILKQLNGRQLRSDDHRTMTIRNRD